MKRTSLPESAAFITCQGHCFTSGERSIIYTPTSFEGIPPPC
ncbi:MAG: hypothetical protein ACTSRI_09240 [Promethearchaeota archaeon]